MTKRDAVIYMMIMAFLFLNVTCLLIGIWTFDEEIQGRWYGTGVLFGILTFFFYLSYWIFIDFTKTSQKEEEE